MRFGKWTAKLLALTAFLAATPLAVSANDLRAGTPGVNRRSSASLTPRTLNVRWPTDGVRAGESAPAIDPTLGLAPAAEQPQVARARSVAGVPGSSSPAVSLASYTPAVEMAEPVVETPETMQYVGHGQPFRDFTQLPEHGCGTCGVAGCTSCGSGVGIGPEILPGMAVDHFSLFGGVHGFKNSGNRGQDSSFGFQEGFNFGTSARNIIFPPTVGLQFGMQATQSNLDGAAFTTAERNQIFMTVGGFPRADCGLQGGLVFDYLWDDWYYDLSVGQMRGEISMAISSGSSYGFWMTAPIEDDTVVSQVNGVSLTESWETMDIYALFFRSNLLAGGSGEGRLYAGVTGGSDGIVGAESRLPMMNGWALETEFTYLIPNEPTGAGANETETWNVGINLVWYPGSLACGQCVRHHRPMFDVANNGSLILRAK